MVERSGTTGSGCKTGCAPEGRWESPRLSQRPPPGRIRAGVNRWLRSFPRKRACSPHAASSLHHRLHSIKPPAWSFVSLHWTSLNNTSVLRGLHLPLIAGRGGVASQPRMNRPVNPNPVLETAQLLIVGENRHLDTGAYHCPESVAAPQTRAMTAFLLLSPVPACPNHRSPVISFP